MESGIKLHKVAGVVLETSGQSPRLVDLHLTAHHTILVHGSSKEETWVSHSLLLSIHLQPPSPEHHSRTPLVLRGRDFETYTILFSQRSDAKSIYESLQAVIAKRTSQEHLYAYCTDPQTIDSKAWNIYDPKKEFARMGVFDSDNSKARTSSWRFTNVNASYDYCPTYPATLVVPSKISDTTLNYGKNYRSKARIPGLVYLHWSNLGSITRSSQPMVGLKNNRSIQDEKLIEAVFTSHSLHHSNTSSEMANASYIAHSHTVYGATPTNLIIDARPTTNAMANVAKGAGTENMDYYRNCKKVYLGIDNIHVMRDSWNKVAEATRQTERQPNLDLLRRSNWLKHLSAIIEGIVIIVKAVHLANSHVLVHCSDGWDRTSQLSSLSQLCLDPYYRTKEGLAVLIEKDWVSYGHRFKDRCGHTVPERVQFVNTPTDMEDGSDEDVGFLASFQQRLNFSGSSHIRETCPVFDQFLDVIYQLQTQFPSAFEFNDAFLLDLQKALYDCSHGTFLYNSERERNHAQASRSTKSVWQTVLDPARNNKYRNSQYEPKKHDVLFPEPKKVGWWLSWLKRSDLKAFEAESDAQIEVPTPTVVEATSQDPVLASLPTAGPSSNSDVQNNVGHIPARSTNASNDVSQTPWSANRSFPAVFENPAVTSASTAVQGAMRSAWSAWKSVRTNYEAGPRELKESSQVDVIDADRSSGAWSRSTAPALAKPLPAEEENVWLRHDDTASRSLPQHTPLSASGHQNITPSAETPSTRDNLALQNPTLKTSPRHEDSSSNLNGKTDPLGVSMWQ
ncbi:phosphatases II [Cystobasidium minutum MCA 4210]|uniref:phosphatases II n=1 Tax=Cystobasidium minutum MCA 4210 TaxID=1397322 RepID=UPI0034CEDCBD|eukprot:jgi/Rhomi1/66333/CE66332_556